MAITTFIPEVWAAKVLVNLEKSLVSSAFVNHDYEGDIKKAGDTVHINNVNPITVKDYVVGTDIETEELTTVDRELKIDQQKYINFMLDAVDAKQAAGNLMDVTSKNSAYELADVADLFTFATMANAATNTVGTKSAPIAITADNVYSQIVALKTKLDRAKCPKVGRKLAVTPEITSLLLFDPRFSQATDAGDEMRFNGYVGKVGGFEVYETLNTPSTNNYMTMIATVPGATTFANQILETEKYKPEKRFGEAVKSLHVYGAKTVYPGCVAVEYFTV